MGAALIHRYVGCPTALDETGDIAKFLLLGGPGVSVVNAIWSVGALAVMGGSVAHRMSASSKPPSR